jgi:hypothetical protein
MTGPLDCSGIVQCNEDHNGGPWAVNGADAVSINRCRCHCAERLLFVQPPGGDRPSFQYVWSAPVRPEGIPAVSQIGGQVAELTALNFRSTHCGTNSE